MVRGDLLDVVSYVPENASGKDDQLTVPNVGTAILVLELHDSVSNAIMVRASDHVVAKHDAARDGGSGSSRQRCSRGQGCYASVSTPRRVSRPTNRELWRGCSACGYTVARSDSNSARQASPNDFNGSAASECVSSRI